MKKSHQLLIGILVISGVVYTILRINAISELDCVDAILNQNEIYTVLAEKNNDLLKLSGSLSEQEKEHLIKLINSSCQIEKFYDEITTYKAKHPTIAWINFSVDNVNQLVEIHGVVSSQLEIRHVTEIIKNSYPQKKIINDLSTNYGLGKSDFAENISLILATVGSIQLLDISLKNNELIIKGLARDSYRANQTMHKLHALFDGELKITNQLDAVIKPEIEVESFDFKIPPPELEKQ